MAAARLHPLFGVEMADAVEHIGVLLSRRVALALLRDDVQQDRMPAVLDEPEHIFQPFQIMPIYGAIIFKAHLLKERRSEEHTLPVLLEPVRQAVEALSAGHLCRDGAIGLFDAVIARPRADERKMLGNAADVRRDGHAVVVQDNDELLAALPGIVHGLIGQAAGHCAVAHQGHDVIVLMLQRAGTRHAESGGDGAGGVTGHKRIRHALRRLWEARKAAEHTQCAEFVPPAGQDLVDIGLMPHVEQEPVTARIEYPLQRNTQLDNAEVRGQMTARPGDIQHQKLSNLVAKLAQLRVIQRAQRLAGIDGI